MEKRKDTVRELIEIIAASYDYKNDAKNVRNNSGYIVTLGPGKGTMTKSIIENIGNYSDKNQGITHVDKCNKSGTILDDTKVNCIKQMGIDKLLNKALIELSDKGIWYNRVHDLIYVKSEDEKQVNKIMFKYLGGNYNIEVWGDFK